MTDVAKDIAEENEQHLITHVAQVCGLTRDTRQENVLKELYFLGCLLNAITHGVSRYVALQKLQFFTGLPAIMASICALSRLAMFCIDEEEIQDEHPKEHHHTGRSLKYDARRKVKIMID